MQAQVDTLRFKSILSDSAKALEAKRDYRGAAEIYSALVKKYPDDNDLKIQFAQVLSWSGNLDSALAVYREVLSSEPNSFDALLGYATVSSWKGEYEISLKLLKGLLFQHPSNVEVLVAAARVSFWVGDLANAVKYASRIIELDHSQKDALLILAQAYEKDLNFKSSSEYVERLLRLDPDNETAKRLSSALQNEFLDKLSLGFYDENFGPANRYSNKIVSLFFDRRISYPLEVFGEIDSRDIFGSKDFAGAVGGSYKFSDVFSVYGDFLYGPNSSTAQRERGTIELNYRIFGPLSVTGSYQYLQFAGNAVRVLSPAISYYFSSNDWIMLRAYFGNSNTGGSSTSFVARANIEMTPDFQSQFGGFHGAELYRLFSQSYLTVSANGGFITGKYRFYRNYVLELDMSYTRWSSSPWKWSYAGTLNFLYQW